MQRLSLRLRLAFLVAGTTLPLIIFSAAIVYLNVEAETERAGKRLVEIARSMVIAVDRELEGRIAALEVLSQSTALADDDLVGFRSRAAVFLSRQPPGANLALVGRDGRQVLNMRVRPGTPLPVVTAAVEMQKVFETGQPNVTDYRVGPVGRRPIITVDVPVFRDGKVVYVLSLNPTVELFTELIAKQRSEPDWVIAVFDGAGVVVARKPERFVGQRASPTLYPALMAGTEGLLDTTSLEGTVVFTAFSRSPTTGWSVAIGVPRATITRPLWHSIAGTLSIGLIMLLIGLAFAVSMATQMARAAAHRELLINELNHRVKNTLTTVQSIVGRTLRGGGAGRAEAVKTLEARLMALSRTHNVLSAENWDSANLHDIAHQALAPYAAGDRTRVHVDGPAVRLRPRASLTTAMVLHELATNAAKYGALSNASGRVSLTWTIRAKDQGPTLRLLWRESGGPPVQQPGDRKGFGSTLIDKGIAHELGGSAELAFEPAGVTCTIEFPLAATQSAESKTETVSSSE